MTEEKTGEIVEVITEDQKFQFAKWVELEGGTKGLLTVISLSPNSGMTSGQDRAFESCREFAEKAGYSRVALVYLYGHRAFDPSTHFDDGEETGADCDKWIAALCDQAEMIVVGWGDFPRIKKRVYQVMNGLGQYDLFAVQLNANGTPTHPVQWKRKAAKMYRRAKPGSLKVAG